MTDAKFIAVDLGAESGRVMLGTLAGGRLELFEAHRFPNIPVCSGTGTWHWDILRLWHEIKTGIAKVTAGHQVSGIGVDAWGVDFGLLDARGDLLGNPVCYRDARTEGMPAKVFARLSQKSIYALTGIQTMPINTLFHLAALSYGNSPQLAAARKLLFIPDLIAYWLCGAVRNEYTIASTSQMLNAKTRTISAEILAALGVPGALFPPVINPAGRDSICGLVQPGPGDMIHASGIPVIAVGAHDTASAVAAVPAGGGDDWLYLSSGTWSLLGAEVDAPVLTDKAVEYNVTNEGGVGRKIRLLKNIAGLWLLQECRREWARGGAGAGGGGQEMDYATLTRLAEAAPAHLALLEVDDPALVVTGGGGMPGKIAAQCRRTGQRVPGTPGEFARVIFESLAARYARVAQMMEELTGRKFRRLHIVGGGSQNNLLNQLAADATGMTVLAGPVEATAAGNILSQAITTGVLGSIAEGRAVVARSFEVKTFVPRKG